MNTASVDLIKFCDADSVRMAAPFVIDGWKYATNGRVCVRVLANEPNTDLSFEQLHVGIPNIFVPADCSTPWPEVELCDSCSGRGRIPCECQKCFGSGTHECDCGDEHDCPHCEGSGRSTDDCQCRRAIVPFGNVRLSKHYAHLIGTLPQPIGYAVVNDIVHFTFAGGEGIAAKLRGW